MQALTIWQPWATAIIEGLKRIENRTWSTSRRGLLVIHAGQRFDDEAPNILAEATLTLPKRWHDVPRGVILGTVELVDLVRMAGPGDDDRYGLRDNPLADGPYCWLMADPKPFKEPVPCRGAQGIWHADLAQLAGVDLPEDAQRRLFE